MFDNQHLLTFRFEASPSLSVPANDNLDWALDLVSSFRVLREIRRRVLIRWLRCPTYRDAVWLGENLAFLQRIWRLLRDHRFTD